MKIGMLGTGGIARMVAPALVALPEIECYAAASRDYAKAETFARDYGFRKVYGSYEELLSDEDVELVYIGTPHSHHYEHIMACLSHGKHVLCEKAFTMNASQAKAAAAFANEEGLYLAEAIWPRYMPSRAIIDRAIESGIIGRVDTLSGNLSYVIHGVPRIQDPSLAGGALLDIGVYGLNFALMHFGHDIVKTESSVRFTESGVDGMEVLTLHYSDGRMAVLTHSIYSRSDRKGIIWGDKGYIVVENINNPQSISVYDTEDRLLEHYEVPAQINGYEYEFAEAVRCIREGKTESDSMPLADTIALMELMDHFRASWGLKYPQEQ